MSSKLSIIFSLCIVILLPACSMHPSKVALYDQTYRHIDKADHVVIIPQNNLDVTVQASNPGNSGLLGALIVMAIDSSRQSSAEEAAAPIIKKLENYDFRSVVSEKMSNGSKNLKKQLLNDKVQINEIDTDDQKRISYQNSTASAVLFTNIYYQLKTNNLIISASTEMYPKSKNLLPFRHKENIENELDEGNVIYRQRFQFMKNAVSADNIVASLNEGVDSIVKQMLDNLNNPVPDKNVNDIESDE